MNGPTQGAVGGGWTWGLRARTRLRVLKKADPYGTTGGVLRVVLEHQWLSGCYARSLSLLHEPRKVRPGWVVLEQQGGGLGHAGPLLGFAHGAEP